MTTKAAALSTFWRSFGLKAYEENSVPDQMEYPYITYQVATGSAWGNIILSASIWDYSTSFDKINQTAEKIGKTIGRSGVFLPYDGGAIWLRRGTPFMRNTGDNSDPKIKRIFLNLTAEYISND